MLPDGTWSSSPRIGHNVDIGVNVTIIGDIEIGDNVIIGAGSVVTKNVPANSVMVGNPARLLKKVYDHHSI
jgi:putative colanic acid biosynthesis acetyltransferase WcaB